VLRRLPCYFVCSSTGHWHLAFFLIGGSSGLLTLFFKSVKRNDVSNYRGIAILLTVGKLLELLVYRHMYEDLKSQLANCQHGFVKSMSTVSNLLEYSSFVLKSIENGCQVDLIYTDFSKAFDKVRHRLLLDKMSTDVEPSHCQWLGFYFFGVTVFLGIFWSHRAFHRVAIWGHSVSFGL
jgi:sterol desaturase/sphingolipid hydroxylase (fatty acid hydroxylase superfamily)